MGHWYDRAGRPRHTIKKKTGRGDRDTTLRDAKKFLLVPSVTGINNLLAKKLDDYKANQILTAVLNKGLDLAYKDIKQWKGMIKTEADQHRKKAKEWGDRIHTACNQYFTTGLDSGDVLIEYIKPACLEIQAMFDHEECEWKSEQSYVSALGYGGSIDLHNDCVIVDFKAKAFKEADKSLLWPEYYMQLAAYSRLLEKPNIMCYNMVISTVVPGLFYLHRWTDEEIELGWKKFKCLLDYWKLDNNYESGWNE